MTPGLTKMEQLLAYYDRQLQIEPPPKGKHHVLEWAIHEMERLYMQANRECAWTRDEDYGDVYDGACSVKWEFTDGGPRENRTDYCPQCGGRIKLEAT
jgi:prophage maintenance system killer protein